jgi:hypothetical protein
MFDDSKVSYALEVYPENCDVRGHHDSGDDDFDRSVEDTIFKRLDDGDVWAWAIVKVTATYDGVDGVEGTDYLGACNYADEEDFKAGGYWEDMKDEARCALYETLTDVGAANPVEVIVIVRGGVVQNVYTDRPANVQIKDFDDAPEGELCTDGMEIGY